MEKKYFERMQAIKLNISYFRKKKGLTQEELAEKVNISRTHLSNIEAPNMATGVTIELLYEIADALELDVAKLLEVR